MQNTTTINIHVLLYSTAKINNEPFFKVTLHCAASSQMELTSNLSHFIYKTNKQKKHKTFLTNVLNTTL